MLKPGFFVSTPFDYIETEKDARIAELEKQVVELTAERKRGREIAGAYYVVPKETLEAKDARIKELEVALHETSAASAKASWQEKRLSCEEGKYDKCGVGGVSLEGAVKAATLAEQMLSSGFHLSYAGACLLVLHRELANISEKQRQDEADRKKRAGLRAKSLIQEVDRQLTRLAENY